MVLLIFEVQKRYSRVPLSRFLKGPDKKFEIDFKKFDFGDSVTLRIVDKVKRKQGYHERASKRPNRVWVNEPINIKNIRV